MNKYRSGIVSTAVLAIVLCAITWFIAASAFALEDDTKAADATINLTPLPGNPQRKAILDALRSELKRLHGMDLLFVVKHLRAKDGWAWIHTLPQSPDGQQRYEDVSALLQLQNGVWTVVELPCTEVDDPECLGGAGYFSGLQQRFVEAPAIIFPSEQFESEQKDEGSHANQLFSK